MKNFEVYLNELIHNEEKFFRFMKERYPLIFNSNIFFRDIQYAIRTYFERKDIKLTYPEAEELMNKFTSHLEKGGKLDRLTTNAWRVNFTISDPYNGLEQKAI